MLPLLPLFLRDQMIERKTKIGDLQTCTVNAQLVSGEGNSNHISNMMEPFYNNKSTTNNTQPETSSSATSKEQYFDESSFSDLNPDTDPEIDSDYCPTQDQNSKVTELIKFDKSVIVKTHRAAIRMNVSNYKLTELLNTIVVAGGGNPSNHPLSFTSGFKIKTNVLDEDYEALISTVQHVFQTTDEPGQILFDGKMMKVLKICSIK